MGHLIGERTPKISTVGNFEVDLLREGSIQRYKEDLFLLTEDTLYELNKGKSLQLFHRVTNYGNIATNR